MTTEPFSPYIIRAEQFDALTDAAQIRERAEKEREACLEEARKEAQSLLLTARKDAESMRQQAGNQAREEISRYLQTCEQSIADLSFLIARRLIDDLPRDEKLARLVRTALADFPQQMGLVLKVPVSEAASLKTALQKMEGVPASVWVVESADLAAGEAVLQHEQGQVRLDVASQLRALWQGAVA
ncbi:hypothetical protein AA0312_1115 [Acetobacter tropicalis NRIC 0312]|uniref:Type III secretion system protein n=1 Tax=Acetobacter tropicalis TaxID=104102 RepID=A0A511FRL1_9PROT|nr:hypothetical protein [Acetobacter tropicalis]KXV50950.1 hypothetical protein AD944_03520 [Acetobacter tropicalis]GAL98909.1 hypothetical protein ATR1_441d0009 [Acetobacter tropicalis]GBR68860.1 hypothetical protein AA0312_1115 [Acetobacter tropicalis NRIC 0312]GEL51535.1 hypothetical protein ATR01nite_26100 [Acetobacter tropicalis]